MILEYPKRLKETVKEGINFWLPNQEHQYISPQKCSARQVMMGLNLTSGLVELSCTQCFMEKCLSEILQKRSLINRYWQVIINYLMESQRKQEILSKEFWLLITHNECLSNKSWITHGWNNLLKSLLYTVLLNKKQSEKYMTWVQQIMTPWMKKKRIWQNINLIQLARWTWKTWQLKV